MKYYLAMTSESLLPLIIMREDLNYYWFYQLPLSLDTIYFNYDTDAPYTIDEWLANLGSYNMQLLASFDDYAVFKRDFPEYFI